jgi:uncharacterized protein (DUF924 family)
MAAAAAAQESAVASPNQKEVLSFWFGEEEYLRVARDPLAWPEEANKRWFFGGKEVDDAIRSRFLPLLGGEEEDGGNAAPKPLQRWLDDDLAEAAASPSSFLPLRALAGIVVMDQFSRNAFRGSPRAFALDAEALRWSRALIDSGLHRRLAPAARLFVLLPFEHSEDLETQRESVRLFEQMRDDAVAAAAAAAAAGAEAGVEAEATAALLTNTQGTLDFAQKHLDVIQKWGRFPGRNAALGRESTEAEREGLASGTIAKW